MSKKLGILEQSRGMAYGYLRGIEEDFKWLLAWYKAKDAQQADQAKQVMNI